MIIVAAAASCSREDRSTSLIGTWEWTGDACDEQGNCRKEILTDEEAAETFTRDGLYRSTRVSGRYRLKGDTILIERGSHDDPQALGEIVSIKGDCMILRKGGSLKRYNRRVMESN